MNAGGAHRFAKAGRVLAHRLAHPGDAEVEELDRAVAGQKMLSGLTSRCTMPCRCADARTSRSRRRCATPRSHRRPRLGAAARRASRPSKRSITKNTAPSSATSFVEHRYGAGVPHPIGGISLVEESLLHVIERRKLGMEHLEGDPLAVAMGSRIDGSHAAEAEQGIEPPSLA